MSKPLQDAINRNTRNTERAVKAMDRMVRQANRTPKIHVGLVVEFAGHTWRVARIEMGRARLTRTFAGESAATWARVDALIAQGQGTTI